MENIERERPEHLRPTEARKRPDRIATRIVLREYIESLVVALVLALILRFFVVAAYKIPTGSMAPTLKVGDFIISYRLAYGFPIPFSGGERAGLKLPDRGDVVVFRFPGNESVNYVKRVVGLPGDQIQIIDKKLFINGTPAEYEAADANIIHDLPGREYYSVFRETLNKSSRFVMSANESKAEQFGPVVVPPNHIFVLGDNRDSSDDSRYWGSVPVQNLEGEVLLVWMSLDWQNKWFNEQMPGIRWERLFQFIK